TDPYQVARCLPGAAITEKLDENSYAGTITIKVGPVTANYRGKMRFEKLDPEAREAGIVGSGQETRGKGGADMKMKSRVISQPDGSTQVIVNSDVNVVGALAQFGRGMIQDVSDQLFQKFTEAMRRELETAPPTESGSAAAAPSPPPPVADALDVGSLGAAAAGRAAGRTLRKPVFWIILILLAVIIYWFLRSQS
ncbi:MAG TPA: SRPBCC family protein, partial [Thermoanaerobaculia bacterium]|nr:SRPBCC family protein [Thermoanaerobaculia bacterium]